MDEPYDLMGSVLSTKADEQMIGFAGFMRPGAGGDPALEGIVKVSAFHRADGSGYLTLTFIIDCENGASAAERRTRLGKPDPEELRKRLGSNFEMLIDIPLSQSSGGSPFFIEEFDVYFRHLRGQERGLAESTLLPALSQLLDLTFEPLNAWQPGQESPLSRLLPDEPAHAEEWPGTQSRSLLQRLFGRR